MCRLNAKFALGQNVPNSFTNRIACFIFGETCAQGRSTRLCLAFNQTLFFSSFYLFFI